MRRSGRRWHGIHRVIIMGEDLRRNLFGTSSGLVEEFGEDRVRDVPLSENGFVGAAVGAAMTGLRPIVDITIASFMYCAMDQFVSQAAKNHYMFGGQAAIPVVYRAAMFYSGPIAAPPCRSPVPDVHERARAQDRRAELAR